MKKPPAQPEPRDCSAAISRMPRAVRDAVSRALVDGHTWRHIRDLCKAHGFEGVTAQNVSNYKKGAHQEWLRREERIEAARRDGELTASIISAYTETGGSPAEAGLMAAGEVLASALSGLGPESLRELIATDPKALFSITRELARVADLLQRKREVKTAKESTTDERPTLTPEARAAMMKEIFGLPA